MKVGGSALCMCVRINGNDTRITTYQKSWTIFQLGSFHGKKCKQRNIHIIAMVYWIQSHYKKTCPYLVPNTEHKCVELVLRTLYTFKSVDPAQWEPFPHVKGYFTQNHEWEWNGKASYIVLLPKLWIFPYFVCKCVVPTHKDYPCVLCSHSGVHYDMKGFPKCRRVCVYVMRYDWNDQP